MARVRNEEATCYTCPYFSSSTRTVVYNGGASATTEEAHCCIAPTTVLAPGYVFAANTLTSGRKEERTNYGTGEI